MASSASRQLAQLASDLHALALEVDQPSRSIKRADELIACGEKIAADVRAVFRGPRR